MVAAYIVYLYVWIESCVWGLSKGSCSGRGLTVSWMQQSLFAAISFFSAALQWGLGGSKSSPVHLPPTDGCHKCDAEWMSSGVSTPEKDYAFQDNNKKHYLLSTKIKKHISSTYLGITTTWLATPPKMIINCLYPRQQIIVFLIFSSHSQLLLQS